MEVVYPNLDPNLFAKIETVASLDVVLTLALDSYFPTADTLVQALDFFDNLDCTDEELTIDEFMYAIEVFRDANEHLLSKHMVEYFGGVEYVLPVEGTSTIAVRFW
ncbi:hypothetical protein ACLPJK_26145 [Pseudomonas aeruginosa]|uniref:hypothetical protein n=1 Tax=Pseudomonas aeruginosa TaxID=287 RepID=UPI003D28D108